MNVMRRTVTGSCSVILNLTMTSLSRCGSTALVDVGEEVALLGVRILDLLHAAADRRHAEDRVRLDLDGLLELVVLDLAVARRTRRP